ncbi:MAG: ATP-binding protein [Prevotella sp.]|nr:ATP-binding protein [Prevotella sp.]
MRTANNTNSNYTVENLVAKYRNYVMENCPVEYFCDDYQDKDGKWHTSEGYTPFSPQGDADEQLLVTLYKQVAANDADKRVLTALSKYAEVFYHDALTEEEFSFLCANLKDAVACSFSHRKEQKWELGYEPIPNEILEVIKENTIIQEGRTVFIADSGNGDVASLFNGCSVKGFMSRKGISGEMEELWALTQIRLYSQGIQSDIHFCEEGCTEASYLDNVDCIIWGGTSSYSSYDEAVAVYQAARPGAQLILFMNERDAAGEKGDTYDIRKAIVDDKAIKSVISFEYKDMWLNVSRVKIALLVEKQVHETVHIKNCITDTSFDVPTYALDHELLWPSFYNTKRPDSGIPFSELVTFVDLNEREVIKNDGDWVLSEEVKQMPVAVPAKMAKEYKDANLLTQDLDLAGSKKFDDQWKFWIRVLKEPCVLLYGNKEKTVVGYIRELPKTGFATLDTIVCIVPKAGVDVRYIATLLLNPEIKGQLESICQGSINDLTFPLVMNKVIVPNHSDKERVEFLSESNYEAMLSIKKEIQLSQNAFEKSALELKKAQQGKLYNFQHSMRKPIREIGSAVRRMERYINENINSDESKDYLQQRIDNIKKQKDNLSDEIDHLTDENKFNEPIVFDINHCLGSYTNYFCNDIKVNFCNKIAKKATHKYMQSIAYRSLKENEKQSALIRKKESLSVACVDIAEYNFRKLVKNILDNAEHHGFFRNMSSNKTVNIVLDWDNDKKMYIIDFRNNGAPLPIGVTKDSFAEYKNYAGVTGNSGIGGSEVAENVKHYNGDFDIFQDGEWVVVRIYLPKSKAYDKGL